MLLPERNRMYPALPSVVRTRVFRPQPTEGYEWALPVDDEAYEVLRVADGTGALVAPPRMFLLRAEKWKRQRKRADMPWLSSHFLVLRDDAIEAVGPLLAPYGLVQPLPCSDARLVCFIARQVAGTWDEATSDVVHFKSSGRILDLPRPSFRQEVVANAGAFRLAEMPRGHLYLTDVLVEAIGGTGMTAGTEFTLVAEAELPGTTRE